MLSAASIEILSVVSIDITVGGPDIIRDVVVGMVETQLYFFLGTKQPGSVKFGIS